MADAHDEILAEALAAYDVPAAPDDFAAATAARAPRVVAHEQRARTPRTPRTWWVAAAAVLLALAGSLGWSRRRIAGEAVVSDASTRSETVQLGRRGRVVLEAGTHVRYEVGGLWPTGVDTVELLRGSAFFRVDTGGEFEVRTAHGTVRVTGTCFRVALRDRQDRTGMNGRTRAGWFAAGALATGMIVAVYEGGVRVASAHGGTSVQLEPGQAAAVDPQGALVRLHTSADPQSDEPESAAVGAARAGERETRVAASAGEIARLRQMLVAHGISPETGATVAGAAAADAGRRLTAMEKRTTDLTPAEWRELAEHGELRFALPGEGVTRTSPASEPARAIGIPESEVPELDRIVHEHVRELHAQVSALYREATGADPGVLSLHAMINEVEDKTPTETVNAINLLLARERGGLAPVQTASPQMSPYERMMRIFVGYETRLERAFAAVVGPQLAHELIFGAHHLGGNSSRIGAPLPASG